MGNAKVSIILTTYNRPRLLMDRAIPSILAQTDPDWECHVVGDGTDGETCIAMGELCKRDRRFRFTNLRHAEYPPFDGDRYSILGYASLNHGLDTARGEYVTTLADDDAYRPDHNAVLLAAIREKDVDFVYGVSEYRWNDGRQQRAGSWPPGTGAFCDGAQLYRHDMGYRYDPTCYLRGKPLDGDLWGRMVEGGVTFSLVPTVVLDYHVGRQ